MNCGACSGLGVCVACRAELTKARAQRDELLAALRRPWHASTCDCDDCRYKRALLATMEPTETKGTR